MDRAFYNLVNKAERVADRSHEVRGEDGFLHCSVCNDPLEVEITDPLGRLLRVRCVCRCVTAEMDAREERKRRQRCEDRREICFRRTSLARCTFDRDDCRNASLSRMMRTYAEQFKTYRKSGKGLLLYGTVGTGKSYYAACIANAVIDAGYSAYMTSFSALTGAMESVRDRAAYIEGLMRYDLLVIDDLGSERKSEYMQEQVWRVVDARYLSGLPMIITTNLTAEEIDRGAGVENKRIYSRILERCLAVEVAGKDRRREMAKKDWEEMRTVLMGTDAGIGDRG